MQGTRIGKHCFSGCWHVFNISGGKVTKVLLTHHLWIQVPHSITFLSGGGCICLFFLTIAGFSAPLTHIRCSQEAFFLSPYFTLLSLTHVRFIYINVLYLPPPVHSLSFPFIRSSLCETNPSHSGTHILIVSSRDMLIFFFFFIHLACHWSIKQQKNKKWSNNTS